MNDPEVSDKLPYWIQVIKDVGFPIVVAGWLMRSTDKLLREILTRLARVETKMGLSDKEDNEP